MKYIMNRFVGPLVVPRSDPDYNISYCQILDSERRLDFFSIKRQSNNPSIGLLIRTVFYLLPRINIQLPHILSFGISIPLYFRYKGLLLEIESIYQHFKIY